MYATLHVVGRAETNPLERPMTLTIVEYAGVARSTAIYREDRKYEYPSLGVGGEVGELLAKIDQFEFVIETKIELKDIEKEVGDVLWYIVNTALDAGIKIVDLIPACCNGTGSDTTFADIQKAVPDTRPLVLAGFSGKVCELAKKYTRDDAMEMTDERRWNVQLALVELLLGLGGICNRYGLSLENAASGNLEKLLSRQKRGVLQGSGDNR